MPEHGLLTRTDNGLTTPDRSFPPRTQDKIRICTVSFQAHTFQTRHRLEHPIVQLSAIPVLPINTDPYELEYFHHFAAVYNGLEHTGGVPVGGTFVVVKDGADIVVADFSLPMSVLI